MGLAAVLLSEPSLRARAPASETPVAADAMLPGNEPGLSEAEQRTCSVGSLLGRNREFSCQLTYELEACGLQAMSGNGLCGDEDNDLQTSVSNPSW